MLWSVSKLEGYSSYLVPMVWGGISLVPLALQVLVRGALTAIRYRIVQGGMGGVLAQWPQNDLQQATKVPTQTVKNSLFEVLLELNI